MTDSYAVIGQPVAHSLSPRIHRSFGQALGIDLEYSAIEVAADGILAFLLETPLRGINVTMPLKTLAYRLATEKTARADQAGAVNTLTRLAAGRYAGDNTDGAGLMQDLSHNLKLPLAGARVLVIGAGGATRGIIGPLLAARPGQIRIANRTADRARRLAAIWRSGDISGCGLERDDLVGTFDAIIHASGAGYDRFPDLPRDLLAADGWCYDLSYGPAAGPFLNWAHSAGCSNCHDGLGMLVEQAAESFSLWHGQRPDTSDILKQLRNQEQSQ